MKHTRDIYATATGDRNDCSVRAFSTAACVSYDEAHALFAKYGRRDGRKTPTDVTWRVIKEAFPDARMMPGNFSMLDRFAANHPEGHYIVHVRGHAFAICDGVVHDWRPAPRRRVKHYWKLV